MTNNIPLALYIHIPFCEEKCPYCDFNSHKITNPPFSQYVDALIQDLQSQIDYIQNRSLTSIFFGGGTPSLLPLQDLERLFIALNNVFDLTNVEITLESNPASAETDKFKEYKNFGINRLSIGVQSFNDDYLRKIGRIHSSLEAKKAIIKAQNVGFTNINIDLMHNLPQQTVQNAITDLQNAIQMQTNHLSWYQLTIEKNTYFYKQQPQLPDEDTNWQIFSEGLSLLNQHFQQYEVSAFGNNYQCLHNLNYWNFGDYLAIGAGAHGKITLKDKTIIRFAKTRMPKDYLQNQKAQVRILTKENLAFEFMLNAMRLKQGFHKKLFESRTFLHISNIKEKLQLLTKKGLIIEGDNMIKTTEKGFLFLNDVLEIFLD